MGQTKLRWIFGTLLLIAGFLLLLKVKKIAISFAAGAVIAYLLSPMVNWLEKKGLRRRWAIALIFFWIVVLLAVLFLLLLPTFYLELGRLTVVLPERLEVIYHYVQTGKSVYPQNILPEELSRLMDKKLIQGQSYLTGWLEKVMENIPALLSSIGLMVLSPILAIYFLTDWRKITDGVLMLVPGRMREQWHKVLQEIDYVIKRYIQGNMIDAVIVGFLIGIGIKLIGMEYALIIGIICGITNLIPYFGPILGGIPSILLGLSRSPLMAVKVTLVIFIVQQLDSNLINPRLMSNKIGLHPLWVVFALLAGGEIGGLLGMLFAVPLAAVLRIIIRNVYYYLIAPRDLKSTKN